jgi:uncharacterized membrane protein required for colicin V production
MDFNWLDITIICILLFGALDGMVKGFIVSFLNMAGIFIALIVAKYFSASLSNLIILNTSLYDGLKEVFVKRMDSLDLITINLLKIIHIKNVSIEDTLTIVFINIACFLCIFMISGVIINIVKDSLKIKVRKSSLKYVDKFGGFAIGFIKSTVFIFLFFALVTPVVGMLPKNSNIFLSIESSQFAKYFFIYNFVIPWFEKINNFKDELVLLKMIIT